jgi:hypothetical protein
MKTNRTKHNKAGRAWDENDRRRIISIRAELKNVDPVIDPMPFMPNWVRSVMPHLKGAPFVVLCAYVSHANNKTGVAWPAIRTLAAETGYGHCAVDQARAFLLECGLLVRLGQEHRGGRWGKTRFKLGWKAYRKSSVAT